MLRILLIALPKLGDAWVPAVAVMSALTLIIGNVTAITQHNIKRLLGYSSIAHAGFILIAVAANGQQRQRAERGAFLYVRLSLHEPGRIRHRYRHGAQAG